MLKDLVDDRLILDTGDYLGYASALRADRHIDVEHALQALRPGHGLGHTEKGISSIDTGGVALAAIKGLNEVVQAKDKEIESLKERLTMLENLVNKLTAKEVVMNQ